MLAKEFIMLKKNEGFMDRFARVVIGAGVLSLAFVGPHTPWAYIGAIPLLTGLIGSCPAYQLLGISTCPLQKIH